MKLSIVIPARNEAENIGATLNGLRTHLDQANIANFEILVIDDGSRDGTGDRVRAVAAEDPRVRVVRNEGRNGFGRAITMGLNHFSGDAVVIYMADASDDPAGAPRRARPRLATMAARARRAHRSRGVRRTARPWSRR